MAIFSKHKENNFDDFMQLQKLLQRESLQKMKLLSVLLAMFLVTLFVHFQLVSDIVVLRLLGVALLLMGVAMLWLMNQIWQQLRAGAPIMEEVIRSRPQQIVWIYSINFAFAPAGIYLYTRGTLTFGLTNGERHTLYGSGREVTAAKRYLARHLPQATFGYTREREQWYMASPLLLWNESYNLPDTGDEEDDY
jgi:hypothetical protein